MEVLHKSVVSSCEYLVEGELALILYKGTIDKAFIYNCIRAKAGNIEIRKSRFLILDMRASQFEITRDEIVQIADHIRNQIGLKASLAIIVDQPKETAIAYLLRQGLKTFDVQVYTVPDSAFCEFSPRAETDLYASKIFSLMCG